MNTNANAMPDDPTHRAVGSDKSVSPHTIDSAVPLTLRPATRADCAALAAIYNAAIRSGQSTMDTEAVDAAYFNRLINWDGREQLIAGCVADELVGWGVIKQYSVRPGYRFACETSVYVGTAHQGAGIGFALQTAIIDTARELGYRHLVAKILAVNEHSIRFHKRCGFEVVGQQHAIGCLQGVWHDVVIMQQILTDDRSDPLSAKELQS